MGTFKDGRRLRDMREPLEEGSLSLREIPAINVVLREGTIYSADNRRLWSFKHSGMPRSTRIPVKKSFANDNFMRKLSSFNEGLSIARRIHQKSTEEHF